MSAWLLLGASGLPPCRNCVTRKEGVVVLRPNNEKRQ
jgi:hypothetical protein